MTTLLEIERGYRRAALAGIKTGLALGALIGLVLLLAGCADAKLPPLPTPGPDMCLAYSSFRYSDAAAKVEALDALRKHNANEITFAKDCLLGDRSKSGGPR